MSIQFMIFDWAGTLVDFGCRAPLTAFVDAFAAAGLPISEAVARIPMGAHKRDHAIEILGFPEVAGRVRSDLGREPDETLVDEIYADFTTRLLKFLPLHAAPIPGAVEMLAALKERGIKVGSTTGYTRSMMDILEPLARAAGVDPGRLICSDEVTKSRPAPWACLRLAEWAGVYPMSRCAKVGDTPADMAEGVNSGMVTVGVTATGNEVGLSQEELEALPAAERETRLADAAGRLRDAGAQHIIESVADLPALLDSLNARP